MKIIIFIGIFCFVTTMCVEPHIPNTKKIILIDTDGHQQQNYKSLTHLISALDVHLDYVNLYTMLEGKDLAAYDGMVLVLGIPYIRSIKNPLALDIMQQLQTFCAQGNKKIMLLFPSPNYSPALHEIIRAIFNSLWNQPLKENQKTELDNYLRKALESDAKQAMVYGTTLLLANKPASLKTETSPTIFAIHNAQTNNDFLLGRFSDFSYADIGENFFKNPFDITLRDALLTKSMDILQNFFSQKKATLPPQLTVYRSRKTTTTQTLDCKYSWILQRGISCAWLSPDDFFGADIDTKMLTPVQQKSMHENSLQNGMSQLANSNYNLLWFEFIPEWYLSPHGYRKEQREEFIERIKKISTQIKKTYKDKPLPKIFVGVNLTSNFRNRQPVHQLTDMWGKTYPNIPCPLDVTNFWQPELFEPLKEFVTLFSSQLPIDGVFLDLEMYHAQDQLAHYGDVHDFSDFAWNICTANIGAQNLATIDERINYLRKNKKFNGYFACLESQATALGKLIKQKIRTLIPHALIGAYAMTLPESWFYRGLTRGLSSPSEPLLYTDFNTDFYGHASKLEQQGIYLLHGAVYMLSKLQKLEDGAMITQLRSYHDFVWFNRSSRMAYGLTPEQINQQYWALEASPLNPEDVANVIKFDGLFAKN